MVPMNIRQRCKESIEELWFVKRKPSDLGIDKKEVGAFIRRKWEKMILDQYYRN